MMRITKEWIAKVGTYGILIGLLYLAFVSVNDWAASAFVNAGMASALVTAIELGLSLVAICIAPALSRLIRVLVH